MRQGDVHQGDVGASPGGRVARRMKGNSFHHGSPRWLRAPHSAPLSTHARVIRSVPTRNVKRLLRVCASVPALVYISYIRNKHKNILAAGEERGRAAARPRGPRSEHGGTPSSWYIDGRTLTSCVRTIVAGIHGRCPDVVPTLTSCVLHSLHAIKLRAKPFLKTAAPSGLERKRGATAAPKTIASVLCA